MLETFQGWGAIFYPEEFVQEVCLFAKENDLLVTFDEMQSGFGRTGTLFGYMHYGVEPDLICCGKGASSSIPLSFVLGPSEIMDLPEIGEMSSTHSANPLSCVAGHANLKAIVEDGLFDNSRELGKVFHHKLNNIKEIFPNHIKHIFGRGLLASILFIDNDDKPLSELCNTICMEALKKGLIVVRTGRESIKLAPPLSIKEDALLEGLAVLNEIIEECINESR